MSCTKEIKHNPDSLYSYMSQKKDIFKFGNFYAVERGESGTYFYKNKDYEVEYIFTLTDNSKKTYSLFNEVEIKSDNYLKKTFPEDYLKIKSIIKETLDFSSIVFQKFDLRAVNGWLNDQGKVGLDLSFKDNITLLYFQEPSQVYLVKEKIIKKYNENWILVKD